MPRNRPVEALHPETQARNRDARIVAALERISEVLRNLAWETGASIDLSPLQVQLLAYLHGHESGCLLAVDLAARFHLSKPTVSVALRGLESKGFITQHPSQVDGRAKTIVLTAKGRSAAGRCAAHLDALLPPLRGLPDAERTALYSALFKLLDGARRAGMVRADRMCVTCAHYTMKRGRPFCALLERLMAPEDHRLDCPEHQAA
ncbi:MAG: MarR family winged helix-turn-helix transcriptional regulator [Flavobacteriales bacterium]